jgi:hypothetical protein
MYVIPDQLDAAIRNTLSRVTPTRVRLETAHWTVCIKDARGEVLGEFELGSQEEIGVLAIELEQHGFVPLVDDPDPCDFVFAQVG